MTIPQDYLTSVFIASFNKVHSRKLFCTQEDIILEFMHFTNVSNMKFAYDENVIECLYSNEMSEIHICKCEKNMFNYPLTFEPLGYIITGYRYYTLTADMLFYKAITNWGKPKMSMKNDKCKKVIEQLKPSVDKKPEKQECVHNWQFQGAMCYKVLENGFVTFVRESEYYCSKCLKEKSVEKSTTNLVVKPN